MRIKCGQGDTAVHQGILAGIPCLVITNKGTGTVGEKVSIPGNIAAVSPEDELLTVTFTNEDSVNVWIEKLNEVKKIISNA